MNAGSADTLRVVVLAHDGATLETVRRSLTDAGIPVLHWSPDAGRPPLSPDALIVDATAADVIERLENGSSEGWLTGAVPVLVLADPPVEREHQRAWLEAGAWDIVRLPVDEELFALRLRNILRGRLPVEGPTSEEPYDRKGLLRATEECLALARRHNRPLSAAAFCLDWGSRRSDDGARDIVRRLAATAQETVRRSDLVGVTPDANLVVLLPDTDHAGAVVFTHRLAELLRGRLREWEIAGRILAGHVGAGPAPYPAAEEFVRDAEACLG